MAQRTRLPARLSLPVEQVARKIYIIRGQRVMIDSDLGELYAVATKVLNQAVKRNAGRFPADFMFQLTAEEAECLRSQFVTSKETRGGRRTLPFAFTEHGVAMLSSVLNSERAVQMNILIVRAFIKLREVLATNRTLAHRVEQLTTTVKDHAALFEVVIDDIQKMDRKLTQQLRRLTKPRRKKPQIGFLA
jgi:phage regulator Rha-like protein